MDSTWLVLLALALGLAVGAGFVTLLHFAERRGTAAAHVVSPRIPDGIDQVLEALESAGVVLDPSHNVMKMSPGASAMGLVVNGALVHSELLELVDDVRRSGESISRELVLKRGPFGDASIYLSVRVARLGTRFVLLLADDRTESHRLDEVRRDFVANVSHELKTPIASVGLLAEALDAAADEPAQVRRFANRLTSESARLARLTQEIIELSRLQAQDAIAEASLVDIDAIVATAIEMNRVIAEGNNIELARGRRSRAFVMGDEGLLVMAVNNLVTNAVSYSASGSRVGIGVKSNAGVVEIVVTDQGVGIPEEDQDRVFERFFRVDGARARNTGGTGLGLSIVKHAVQNHGGEIRVWSQPGLGSTFTIRLPEAKEAGADAAPPTSLSLAATELLGDTA